MAASHSSWKFWRHKVPPLDWDNFEELLQNVGAVVVIVRNELRLIKGLTHASFEWENLSNGMIEKGRVPGSFDPTISQWTQKFASG